MRFRSSLMIVAGFVLALSASSFATTALSSPSDLGALTISVNSFADFGQEAVVWIPATGTVPTEFTDGLSDGSRLTKALPDGAVVLEGAAALPPEQARSEARVPEPATLVFVGTGLIGISRFARRKREWKLRTMVARVQEPTAQEA